MAYLTDRDEVVLKWIGEQYAVTVEQLQIMLGRDARGETKEVGKVSVGTAERRVKRWMELGLVERQKLFMKKSAWVWLTREGLSLLERDYRYSKPRLVRLNELEWVNDTRLYVERWGQENNKQIEWRSERQLRYEWGREETTKDKHVPDAEIVIDGNLVALEVELTQKSHKRIQQILRELLRNYGSIWYCTTQGTEGFIKRQKDQLSQEHQERLIVYRLTKDQGQFSLYRLEG